MLSARHSGNKHPSAAALISNQAFYTALLATTVVLPEQLFPGDQVVSAKIGVLKRSVKCRLHKVRVPMYKLSLLICANSKHANKDSQRQAAYFRESASTVS